MIIYRKHDFNEAQAPTRQGMTTCYGVGPSKRGKGHARSMQRLQLSRLATDAQLPRDKEAACTVRPFSGLVFFHILV